MRENSVLLTRVVDAVDERTERGIAASINRMITAGSLSPGTRLPTVRDFARELGVSPTTISEAWQSLSRVGAIESKGRLGTFVIGPPTALPPRRYRRISDAPGSYRLNLSTGTPDPELLPDIAALLGRIDRSALTQSYLDDPVLPALHDALIPLWPFAPEATTVVDGALDAIDRIAGTVVRYGDRVIVENPCFPPVLDLFEQMGAQVVPVELDAHGIVPASLERALLQQPAALFLQPRAHNPTGVSMTESRALQLAKMLKPTGVVVVEDDHSGAASTAHLASIGSHLPSQTVYILGFSKSHGPDLRLAAVGGAGDIIDRMATRRRLGPGWSSRILQSVLVAMLTDRDTKRLITHARSTYAGRRRQMATLLADRGVITTGNDGINLWMEVASEESALLTLAAQGVAAAPGTPFLVAPLASNHIRVTVGQVRDGFEALADTLAVAATS